MQLELDLFERMGRLLSRHKAEELKAGFRWTQWQAIQLRSIRKVRRDFSKRINRVFEEIVPEAEDRISAAYHDAADAADKEILDAYLAQGKAIPWDKLPVAQSAEAARSAIAVEVPDRQPGVTTKVEADISVKSPGDSSFFRTSAERLEIIMTDVRRDMNIARYAAAQRAGTIYEGIVKRADVMFQSGSQTLLQAVEIATKEAAQAGLNCVEYSDGRRVNVATYVEMALRTSARRAELTAAGQKRDEWGEWLVTSPVLHSTCPTCQEWQGEILIDDVYAKGKPDGKHTLLSKAMEPPSHFLGPNCRHLVVTYFEGITQIPTASPEDTTASNYEAEVRQRRIEAQIRRWKREVALAQDDQSIKTAQDKVKVWQRAMRDHLSANPQLRRNPQREMLMSP